jgi:hypothetical protein
MLAFITTPLPPSSNREQGRCYLVKVQEVIAGVIFLRSKIGQDIFAAKRIAKKVGLSGSF